MCGTRGFGSALARVAPGADTCTVAVEVAAQPKRAVIVVQRQQRSKSRRSMASGQAGPDGATRGEVVGDDGAIEQAGVPRFVGEEAQPQGFCRWPQLSDGDAPDLGHTGAAATLEVQPLHIRSRLQQFDFFGGNVGHPSLSVAFSDDDADVDLAVIVGGSVERGDEAQCWDLPPRECCVDDTERGGRPRRTYPSLPLPAWTGAQEISSRRPHDLRSW
jgi:hypothetical protein